MRNGSRLVAAGLLASATALNASAGADVVDDAGVEAAGVCHVETWASALSHGGTLANVGPACTPRRLPWLEIDGAFTYYDPARGGAAETVGFGPKVNLRSIDRGLGIGASGFVAFDLRDGSPGIVTANLPVTVPVGRRWIVNANIGTQWVRGVRGLAATGGVQAVWQPPRGPQLMVEAFRVGPSPVGQQGHLRWTIDRGLMDIDLLAARYPDGVSKRALTLGLTIRR